MEDIVYIGKGVHVIAIRNRGNTEDVDVVRTDMNGMLKYTFPNDGVYDLICKDRPEFSRFAWVVSHRSIKGRFVGIITPP